MILLRTKPSLETSSLKQSFEILHLLLTIHILAENIFILIIGFKNILFIHNFKLRLKFIVNNNDMSVQFNILLR